MLGSAVLRAAHGWRCDRPGRPILLLALPSRTEMRRQHGGASSGANFRRQPRTAWLLSPVEHQPMPLGFILHIVSDHCKAAAADVGQRADQICVKCAMTVAGKTHRTREEPQASRKRSFRRPGSCNSARKRTSAARQAHFRCTGSRDQLAVSYPNLPAT